MRFITEENFKAFCVYLIEEDAFKIQVKVPCKNTSSSDIEKIINTHLDRFLFDLRKSILKAREDNK